MRRHIHTYTHARNKIYNNDNCYFTPSTPPYHTSPPPPHRGIIMNGFGGTAARRPPRKQKIRDNSSLSWDDLGSFPAFLGRSGVAPRFPGKIWVSSSLSWEDLSSLSCESRDPGSFFAFHGSGKSGIVPRFHAKRGNPG